MENVSSNPTKSNLVDVRVIEAHGSGLAVKILESGKAGFIPRREITWERRISVPFKLPEIGDEFKAIILNENKYNKITLSLRRTYDPWREVINQRKYRRGQVVMCDVVNVRDFGAYLQLEPGVDGVVYPREASFVAGESIKDVLWIGDKVEAEITELDLNSRFIELSITQAQQKKQKFMSVDEQAKELLARFGADAAIQSHTGANVRNTIKSAFIQEKHDIQHHIHKLSTILIVDDETDWQNSIKTCLMKKFGASIHLASNKEDALKKFQQTIPYDLVLIDINLGSDDGTELAQTLREGKPYLPILLMSSAPLQSILNQYPSGLVNDEFLFARKDIETNAICQKITDMRLGAAKTNQLSFSNTNTWIQDLGLQAFSDQPISAVFEEILKWLHIEASVSQCFLLKLDEMRREITISASYPLLLDDEIHSAQDGLYYSPASQILEENRVLSESSIDIGADKYKNFFRNFDFNSYLGLPIQIPNKNVTAYALILLDENSDSFLENKNTQKNKFALSQFAAYFLSIAIERAFILDIMRKYEVQYSVGQLTSYFIHETRNKLNGLNANVKRVETIWAQGPDGTDSQATKNWFGKIGRSIQGISSNNDELGELFDDYSREADSETSLIDINQTVLGILKQLSRIADQNNVRLYNKQEKMLPKLQGHQTNVKQIILNLALNAVQMIDLQQKQLLSVGKQATRSIVLSEFGMVIVQTKYIEDDKDLPIEIRVIDSGPGIHWRNWERIFTPGITGRGGSGLGLHISRNLIERMGGRLILLDSVLFVGSAFVIRLPAAANEEMGNG